MHVERCGGHQGVQRDSEPVSAYNGRMQSVGDVAQLAEGFGDLTAGTFQSGLGRGVAAGLLGKQAEFEG
jgi:hypothetical protein